MPAPLIGLIPPPRWPSPSVTELPAVLAAPVRVATQSPVLPGFGYALSEVEAAGPKVAEAAAVLAEMEADAIGMEGTPFAWIGLSSEAAARDRVAATEAAAGRPVRYAGTAILDALRALGAESAALLPTYYEPDWAVAWGGFVAACGIEVASSATMVEQGIVATQTDAVAWDVPSDLIRAAVEKAGAGDVVVVTGAGARVCRIAAELEAIAGRPVIGADTALFWSLAKAADLQIKPGALGALGDG